jgi:hypothetical protein
MADGVISVIGIEVNSQIQTTNVVRFVSCCDGQEILFRGSLTITNGTVYQYVGASLFLGEGGSLQPGRCYTVFLETEVGPLYPATPTLGQLNFVNDQDLGCNDPSCQDCNPQSLCECPEGFTYNEVTGLCERETETIAEYSGTLLPIVAGNKVSSYGKFGVRLYPDITLLTWPLLGSGTQSTYTVNENNGGGAAVIPTANVQNQAFGSEVPGCVTSNTGGRLNKAGIWATGFPNNQELSFEFCVDIPGPESKQYVIGIAGDNKVKISIDGSLAVFLDASGSGVTRPFNHWHTFPITLTPGNHIIKLSGLNIGSAAAFAAEIYDITLTEFQANLLYPAVGSGNCGSTEVQLEPYILFSTRDYIGQSVPNPADPGVWSCPAGTILDECTGIPVCKTIETVELACDCYMVIPCDGTDFFVSNDPVYAPYVDSFTSVAGPEYTGCAYVTKTTSEFCNDSTVTTVPTDTPCDCTLRCWWVQNTNGFLYVDDNDVLINVSSVEANPYMRICSKIPPVPEVGSVNPIVLEIGDCNEGTCPDLCFKLTNCEDPSEVIYSNSDALYQYTFGSSNVVEILGREGCWTVEEGDAIEDECDCLVDVVVIRSYTQCDECIKVPAYRLTSCTDSSVIYTELNLELYVGQVIKIDCGCYEVELIDFKPTNPQIFKIEGLFEECIDCTRTYYELVDCKGEADNVYTYTDLSAYLGQTVNIENCTECWTVNEVVNPGEIYATAGEVTVTDSYLTCEDCDNDAPCICSTVTNAGPTTRVYTYLNCDNESNNITLESGETSSRICVKRWTLPSFCQCFFARFTPEAGVTDTYVATIIQGEFLNGFPVYELCGPGDPVENCGTVSFNGTNWIVYDGNTGDPLYSLPESTDLLCPIGRWETIGGGEVNLSTINCPDICDCVTVTTTITTETGVTTVVYNFALVGFSITEGPIYEDGNGNSMYFDGEIWVLEVNGFTYTLSQSGSECPTGVWSGNQDDAPPLTSNNSCATQTVDPIFSPTDIFKTYGECQHGVCPPPVFINNRTVRPGYNTPICTPEKYNMITCNFADVMYKLVLEKRYGITNCCPEEDEKWIVKKELIDLQALKDPNYNCPNCSGNCDSSVNCSTCNSEN